ncbi:MAG: MEDS domain-containing protein [Anaerolineales bacterium]
MARVRRAIADTERMLLQKTLEHLEPGDHLCCIYETDAEHRSVVAPFLRAGMERHEKVVYVVDSHTPAQIRSYVEEVEADAQENLFILTPQETYLQDGPFDPQSMIAWLKQETEQALQEGYTALRITGEMSWALKGLPGSERLLEYEAQLNTFFEEYACLALCQYDRRRFPPAILLGVLETHPLALIGAQVFENFYYIPPAEFLGKEAETARVRNWIENLTHHKEVETALLWESQVNRALVELSEALISSAGLESLSELVLEHARRLTGSTLGYVGYVDTQRGHFVCHGLEKGSCRGVPQGHTLEGLHGLWGWVVQFRRPLLTNHPASDYRSSGTPAAHPPIRRFLSTPAMMGDRLVGQIALANPGRDYTWRDVEIVERLASLYALAVRQRQREEDLRRERDLLNRIMETSPNAITVVDTEGRITFANRPAEEILGLTQDEITTRTYNAPEWRITDEEGGPFPEEALPFRRVKETGEAVYGVCHAIEWPDGRRTLLSINAAPLTDEEGRFDGIVSLIEDVTERRQAERARIQRLEREIQELENFGRGPGTQITAQAFGNPRLRRSLPELFTGLVERYEELLEQALARRVYKGEAPISAPLRDLAEQLGWLRAGPRDVVEIHARALKAKTRDAELSKSQIYAEEGRLIALELMGYLTAYYRTRSPEGRSQLEAYEPGQGVTEGDGDDD